MVVREGYKLTDIGEIPIDWGIDFIKNLAVIKTGSKNTQDRIENGTYPFFVRSQTVERIDSYSFDGEAVLTAGDGVGVGKVVHYVNEKFDCHQRVYRLTDFVPSLNGYFFFLYFRNNFLKRIMQMTAKSSVDSVRMEMIANMPIPLPPTKSEQTAIATALSDADALITSLEKLIVKKRAIKQGAMQELLTGRKRIANFESNTKYKQTEYGLIPVDWNLVNVGDLTKFHKQGYYTKENYNEDGEYYLLRGTDMQCPRIDLATTPKINANTNDYEAYKVLIGDFIIVRSGAIGRYGIVINDTPKSIFGSYLINFRFNELLDAQYFGYFYQSALAITQIKSITQGGGNLNINAENIKSLKIALPPTRDEQSRIATILFDMDAEITTLELKRSKYKMLKQGMMQELLTGKIRLV